MKKIFTNKKAFEVTGTVLKVIVLLALAVVLFMLIKKYILPSKDIYEGWVGPLEACQGKQDGDICNYKLSEKTVLGTYKDALVQGRCKDGSCAHPTSYRRHEPACEGKEAHDACAWDTETNKPIKYCDGLGICVSRCLACAKNILGNFDSELCQMPADKLFLGYTQNLGNRITGAVKPGGVDTGKAYKQFKDIANSKAFLTHEEAVASIERRGLTPEQIVFGRDRFDENKGTLDIRGLPFFCAPVTTIAKDEDHLREICTNKVDGRVAWFCSIDSKEFCPGDNYCISYATPAEIFGKKSSGFAGFGGAVFPETTSTYYALKDSYPRFNPYPD